MIHEYTDYSGLYDDGYDDFKESEAKKMAKSKKVKREKCGSCGGEFVVAGTCQACGVINAGPSKKSVPDKPDSKDTTTK